MNVGQVIWYIVEEDFTKWIQVEVKKAKVISSDDERVCCLHESHVLFFDWSEVYLNKGNASFQAKYRISKIESTGRKTRYYEEGE